MTIEQEFFEAFKLIECEKCTNKYCSLVGEINYPTSCADKKHIKITPEIVLGLINIITNNNNKLALSIQQDNNSCTLALWEDDYILCNSIEKNLKDALLRLFIDYEEKHELQSEVRALFNEKHN